MTKHVHGGNIYTYRNCLDFSANCNPLGTPESVKQAIRDSLEQIKDYPQVGYQPLKEAIAAYEAVEPEHIICGNGAAEIVFSLCHALKPRKALLPGPTFAEYEQALASVDCEVEHVLLKEENGFALQEDFVNWLHKDLDMVFLCNPNNPTGRLLSSYVLERILDFCQQNHIRLFLDECFLDLSDDGISMKGFLRDHPELFILKAFTKSYGMAGVRLGYCLCSDDELLAKMSRTAQPWNVSILAQAAGVVALQEQDFLIKTKELIPVERSWLKDELENLGFWVCPAKANYLLFHGKPGLHTALKERGIAIRNCDNYHGLSSGWYRIAVRLHEQNEQLIAAIKQVLRKE